MRNYKSLLEEDMDFSSVNDFNFHNSFEDDSPNGLNFNDHYLPEEILWNIFSHISPTELLNLTLVCKKWCNIIKSDQFWMHLYKTSHPIKVKHSLLPWYCYYSFFTTKNFQNLLKNTNGEEGFQHWKILADACCGRHGLEIQDPTNDGADALPLDVKDFNGNTSCFASEDGSCIKIQEVSLENKRLLRYIIKKHKPHIYVSEWWAGRFDYYCFYTLDIKGFGSFEETEVKNKEATPRAPLFHRCVENTTHGEPSAWSKVEIVVKDYPDDLITLVFTHGGDAVYLFNPYYGSKMAGGVLKFVFDSIEPINVTKKRKRNDDSNDHTSDNKK